ncbi:MAG: phosphate signaling complex protein PhoU [Microbacteriaceae bacterium]|nr:phosphate signaling complex protein PhoU [Microbacteriaceae bacterium]
MRKVFQAEMASLQDGLIELAELVEKSFTKATKAFSKSDVEMAEFVIEADNTIDAAAVEIDELAIEILARQSPVARDLRTVVSALRISASLERMGDMAEHIAELARLRYPEKVAPKALKNTFTRMGDANKEIVRMLVELLQTQDLNIANAIRDKDDLIDELHVSVFDTVLSSNWQHSAATTVDATLISRYHERFADHAVSIAKKVIYLATGEWERK